MRPFTAEGEVHLVLVIDDDPDLNEAIRDVVECAGFRTVAAANGEEALAFLEEADELPCLILLDLMMPKMDGWTFRSEQCDRQRLKDIPTVVLTAGGDKQRPIDVPVLQKPVQLERLIAEVSSRCAHRVASNETKGA